VTPIFLPRKSLVGGIKEGVDKVLGGKKCEIYPRRT
jgi:hypothetical protein